MPTMNGSFIWYELMTTDVDAAKRFYTDVVGWGSREAAMTDLSFSYTLFTAPDGGEAAGLMALPSEAAGAPPSWIGYVWAADVDAAAEKLVGLGGTVHRPGEDIPGVGRFAVVADPQGAVFCLFSPQSPGDERKPTPPDAPGRIGWHELMAIDWPKAFDFYAAMFGWTKAESVDMGGMGVYQLFAHDGTTIGGMMSRTAEMPGPFWTFYFNVDAIDAAVERVKAGGGKILHGPSEVPGGAWIIHAMDPQGAAFALVAPKR